MKIMIFAVMFAAVPSGVLAGELEKAAVSLDIFTSPAGLSLAGIPVPKCAAPRLAAARPSPEWIAAVKKTYLSNPIGTLPPALEAELPAAALQQMQWDAHTYPSRAYKVIVDGRPAFVIENDNFDALYVNIFDENGEHIAYGGFDENYDFYWLTKTAKR